jgi:hypothetical protein
MRVCLSLKLSSIRYIERIGLKVVIGSMAKWPSRKLVRFAGLISLALSLQLPASSVNQHQEYRL